MDESWIYLDHNSTAPPLPEALDVMREVASLPLNPSAPHAMGRRASYIIEDARRSLLRAFDISANDWEVVFTATGSEANNIAMRCTGSDHYLISSIDHKSVRRASLGNISIIGVDSRGIVNLDEIKIGPGSTCISVIGANNETGVIQPIDAITRLARELGDNVIVHSDISQMVCKTPVNIGAMGIDMFTVSGHKVGAPQGAAALVYKRNIKLSPLVYGGGQEGGVRSGIQNVASIAAFAFVLSEKRDFLLNKMRELREIRDWMESMLLEHDPSLIIAGGAVERVPNVSCLISPGIDRNKQLITLDAMGVCVGFGSTCGAGGAEGSPTLSAMGYSAELRNCAIRISTGWTTTKHNIDCFLQKWKQIKRDSVSDLVS